MGDLIKWFGSYTAGVILAPCAFLDVWCRKPHFLRLCKYLMGSVALVPICSTVCKVHVSC